jgi:hypothetical protein
MINPIERITQNSIIKLFAEQLGYTLYGDWKERSNTMYRIYCSPRISPFTRKKT